MNPTATWNRLNTALTPRSPADWRRFVALAVILIAIYLLARLVTSVLTGDGATLAGNTTIAILPYVIIGAIWWRSYFQAVVDQAGGPSDRQLRRWLVRGTIVWVLLAYVVLIVTVASYADGDSAENRGDDNASWPLVVLFYLLPVVLAAITALLGRSVVNMRPPGSDPA